LLEELGSFCRETRILRERSVIYQATMGGWFGLGTCRLNLSATDFGHVSKGER
jgi:hypothetical protein